MVGTDTGSQASHGLDTSGFPHTGGAEPGYWRLAYRDGYSWVLAIGAMDVGAELGTLEIGGGRNITDEADMPATITDMDIDTAGSTGACSSIRGNQAPWKGES